MEEYMKDADESHRETFSVRAASAEDCPSIAAIHVLTWQRIYRGIMSDGFLDNLRPAQREPMWNRTLKKGRGQVHVCLGSAGVVGFSSAGPCRDSPADAEIYALYVLPDQWGAGVGRALFLASCEAMQACGFEYLVLWVATRNDLARAFYERAGMVPDGATKTVSIGGALVEEAHYRLDLLNRTD
jgi:ribosomal protein S18 acetylase RimI-like enzyme